MSFEDFVQNRVIVERQRDVPFLFRASNPVQHWNNWNFHWTTIRLNSKKLCCLTYESLLVSTEEVLDQIGQAFDLKRKTNEIVGSTDTFTPSGENLKPSGEKFKKREFYKNREYMKNFTPSILEFVNNELDLDLMIHFGYNLTTCEDMVNSINEACKENKELEKAMEDALK